AIGGVETSSMTTMEIKFPGRHAERSFIGESSNVPAQLWNYLRCFDVEDNNAREAGFAQGLYGYTTYDAVQFFDTVRFGEREETTPPIPLMRYRLYQYVIAINHFKDELFLCENIVSGLDSEKELIESLIKSKDVPVYPFQLKGAETSDITDEDFRQ